MRILFAACFLVVGLGLALLLNGLTFTNSLLGIACASAAAGLAIEPAREKSTQRGRFRANWLLLGPSILLVAFLVAQLPSANRFQAGFNRKMKALRRAGRPPRVLHHSVVDDTSARG